MEITVRAEALGRRAPEVAVLQVRASHESGNQDEASHRAHALMAQVADQLRGLEAERPEAVERLVVLPVGVRSWRPWNNEGKQLPPRHEATGRVELALSDFGLVAVLTRGWSQVEGLSFDPPTWELHEETQRDLEAEVTSAAVRQARRRAQMMADASGYSSVVPVQVADAGLLDRPQPTAEFSAATMSAGARGLRGGGMDEGFDLTPRDIELTVRVEARFRAE